MGRKRLREVRAALSALPENEERVILATGGCIGEGFDDPRLDTLFLTLPISWRGTVAQYVGRLHRLHERKREVVVYDYADLNVPMLARMFDRRCRGYEAAGYRILLPASAVPGWPAGVPLPVDPAWKRDYAASVRRLIRDGVDKPLANLFVNAATTPAAEASGASRARSASEAFLYRRLETLAATRGRFRLNGELPIPFAGRNAMEVDFLCPEAAIVLELDGAQHLASVEAYRSDRRKDYLLQETRLPGTAFSRRRLGEASGRSSGHHPKSARSSTEQRIVYDASLIGDHEAKRRKITNPLIAHVVVTDPALICRNPSRLVVFLLEQFRNKIVPAVIRVGNGTNMSAKIEAVYRTSQPNRSYTELDPSSYSNCRGDGTLSPEQEAV